MKLPFFQHVGIGLSFTAREVRWVELARLRHRVWIRQVDDERIRPDDESASEALSRLVGRRKPSDPRVASHLPTVQVREMPVQVPGYHEEARRRAWIERRAAELLPQGMDARAFMIRYVPFDGRTAFEAHGREDRDERRPARPTHRGMAPTPPTAGEADGERGLLTMARREAVAAHVAMLRDAGLEPAFVGSPIPLLGLALGFDPTFIARGRNGGRAAALWLRSSDRVLTLHEGGRLADVSLLSGPASQDGNVVEAMQEMHMDLRAGQNRTVPLFVVGKNVAEGVRECRRDGSSALDEGCVVRPFSLSPDVQAYAPDPEGARAGQNAAPAVHTPRSEDVPALALAAGLVCSAAGSANLLSAKDVDAARRAAEQRDGLRAVVGVGLVCLISLFATTGLVYGLRGQVQQVTSKLRAASGHLARVDSASARLEALRHNVRDVEAVTSVRTALAPLLEHVANETPRVLWLEELHVTTGDVQLADRGRQGRWRRVTQRDEPLRAEAEVDSLTGDRHATVTLRGWATRAASPARFVAALEESAGLTAVRPVVVERMGFEAAQERAMRWPGRSLFRGGPTFFEIRFEAPLVFGEPVEAEASPIGSGMRRAPMTP